MQNLFLSRKPRGSQDPGRRAVLGVGVMDLHVSPTTSPAPCCPLIAPRILKELFMTHAILFEPSLLLTAPTDWLEGPFRGASFKSRVSGCWGCRAILAQARRGCQHRPPLLPLYQSAPRNRNRPRLYEAAYCPACSWLSPLGSAFAFRRNDNSCFRRRELERLPLPLR